MARLCLSASLRRTERLVTRHYDEHLREAGITAVQLPMLASIAAQEEPTLRLLTETLELERSTLSRNLALLRKRGLIELGPSSGPKPGVIRLTRKGRTTLHRGHQQWLKAHAALLDALGGQSAVEEGMQFLRGLRRTARQKMGVAVRARTRSRGYEVAK
jgi:DNA-binding MarR family transcriptional regulator